MYQGRSYVSPQTRQLQELQRELGQKIQRMNNRIDWFMSTRILDHLDGAKEALESAERTLAAMRATVEELPHHPSSTDDEKGGEG